MEKTLTIDGREITFKSTAAFPMRYKAQFQKDFFADTVIMLNAGDLLGKGELNLEDIQSIDFEIFYNMLWVMAKTADKEIPDPITWLDTFDSFPIMEIIPDVIDLILANLHTTKKK